VKRYKCPKCKTFNRFPLWVYAHWTMLITAKCEKCKQATAIQNGRIVRGD
jgi:phage FluMu protein Com